MARGVYNFIRTYSRSPEIEHIISFKGSFIFSQRIGIIGIRRGNAVNFLYSNRLHSSVLLGMNQPENSLSELSRTTEHLILKPHCSSRG